MLIKHGGEEFARTHRYPSGIGIPRLNTRGRVESESRLRRRHKPRSIVPKRSEGDSSPSGTTRIIAISCRLDVIASADILTKVNQLSDDSADFITLVM